MALSRVALGLVLFAALSSKALAQTFQCSADGLATRCLTDYFFDGAVTYTTPAACDGTTCIGVGQSTCCVKKTCIRSDAQNNDFCPYGYKLLTGTTPATALTVETCCEREIAVAAADATNVAFHTCTSSRAAGAGGVQALSPDDSNWSLQDDNAWARQLGRFTGMCFSVTIDNDCSAAETLIASTCCTTAAPAFLQFKMPTDAGVTDDTGVATPLTSRSLTLKSTNLPRCKLSYGPAAGTLRSLKPVPRWQVVETGASARYVNIPLTFRKGSKQTTVCLYTNNLIKTGVDCTWERMCGFSDETVPTVAGSYAKGCEMRIVGRKRITSAQCCSPTYSVESFASTPMRLADSTLGEVTKINLVVPN